MKLSELIDQLIKIENKYGSHMKVVLYVNDYEIERYIEAEVGVMGKEGEFVSKEEIKERRWDSIIDTVRIG
jgi:2-keto-3-deoxy-6-phosphogluconate aldolase